MKLRKYDRKANRWRRRKYEISSISFINILFWSENILIWKEKCNERRSQHFSCLTLCNISFKLPRVTCQAVIRRLLIVTRNLPGFLISQHSQPSHVLSLNLFNLLTSSFPPFITFITEITDIYYAPPSRPEGPRRCPDRGNVGGALLFLMLLWLLYALGLYT